MKLYFKFLVLLFLTNQACQNSDVESDIPNCIEKEIDSIKNNPVRNPAAQVWKWVTNNQTYYYIPSDCCDQYNYLYDENCTIICAPDGGFTGTGDGKCPDFTEPIEKTLIWEDKRK